jgi:hypothetical protein
MNFWNDNLEVERELAVDKLEKDLIDKEYGKRSFAWMSFFAIVGLALASFLMFLWGSGIIDSNLVEQITVGDYTFIAYKTGAFILWGFSAAAGFFALMFAAMFGLVDSLKEIKDEVQLNIKLATLKSAIKKHMPKEQINVRIGA